MALITIQVDEERLTELADSLDAYLALLPYRTKLTTSK